MQDIKPPSERKAPASTDAEFSTEMVDNVPVQAPSSAAQSTGSVHGNPIAQDSVPGPLEASQEGEMDKILEEVNKKVKSAAADNSPKTSLKDFFKHSSSFRKSFSQSFKETLTKFTPNSKLFVSLSYLSNILCKSFISILAREDNPPPEISCVKYPSPRGEAVASCGEIILTVAQNGMRKYIGE